MKKIPFKQKALLVLLSGILLTLAWPHTGGLTFLIFIGLVPLLYLEDIYAKNKTSSKAIFFPAFISFLIWNIGVTWFIFMIRTPGSTPWEEFISRITASGLAYILNSIFMAIIFWLFHLCKRRLGNRLGYISLIVFWLSFEYLHMHWDINWPWLNLGNVFANYSWAIQWYEYTGVSGGSLWVLVCNIGIYKFWRNWKLKSNPAKSLKIQGAKIGGLVLTPVFFSLIIYFSYNEKGTTMKAIALQPNIDPYNEKFEVDPYIQIEDMMELADSLMEPDIQLVLLPETALLERARVSKRTDGTIHFSGPWEGHYEEMNSMRPIRKLVNKHPLTTVITGLSDRKAFAADEKLTLTARYNKHLDLHYDSYNSLICVTKDRPPALYRKSKLVPGVESVPFGKLMKKIENFALDLGGTTGSLGTQEERTNFDVGGHQFGGMVCYESIYGEFVAEFVQKGAVALSISTNDSWWQTSPGYKQLLDYARLRAIENRRSIIRSANTGISCFIDQRGNIVNRTKWWTRTGIMGELRLNNGLTFYSKHGDVIYRISSFLFFILLLYAIVKPKINR